MVPKTKKTKELSKKGMTLQINDVLNIFNGLTDLSSKELKAIVAFKVSKNLAVIRVETEAFYKVRDDLVKKYGVANDKDAYDFTPENRVILNTEIAELLSTEVEVNLTIINLADIEAVELKPSIMELLLPIIEE